MKTSFFQALAVLAQTIVTVQALQKFPGTAVSWASERLDVVFADKDGNVLHKYHANAKAGWNHGFEALNLTLTDGNLPTAVSWAENRLDIFGASDGKLLHRFWDGSAWQGGEEGEVLGEGIEGDVIATSWAENRLDIFGINEDGHYVHKYWDGSQWQPKDQDLEHLGSDNFGDNYFSTNPAAVSWGPNRLDIFGILNNGTLLHKYWDGTAWKPSASGWEQFGDDYLSGEAQDPLVTSWGENRFDVWGIRRSQYSGKGILAHRYWYGDGLSATESIGGFWSYTPSVINWGPNRIDIYGGALSSVFYNFYDGSSWNPGQPEGAWNYHGPEDAAFEPLTAPIAASWGENSIQSLVFDTSGTLHWQFWEGHQWLPSPTKFYSLGKLASVSNMTTTAAKPFRPSKDYTRSRAGRVRKNKYGLVIQGKEPSLDL